MLNPDVVLDEVIVMPNHIHAILGITRASTADRSVDEVSRRSLGRLIGAFKGTVTKQVREEVGDLSINVWQRGYWESVIRDERHFEQVVNYIRQNPLRWAFDRENPNLAGL